MLDLEKIQWQWRPFSEITSLQLYDILSLRQDVFIREQRCFYADMDYKDQQAQHLLGIMNNQLIAYARFLPKGVAYANEASMGRFVTLKAMRGYGLGKRMMKEILHYYEQHHSQTPLLIAAQCYLQSFYESCGFQAVSEPFDDEGILHIEMRFIPK